MSKQVRLFIAAQLPPYIKTKIYDVYSQLLPSTFPFKIKWVSKDNLHITLLFLGNVEVDKLSELKKILKTVSNNFSKITVTIENFGFFPEDKLPRVFYVKVNDQGQLKKIVNFLAERISCLFTLRKRNEFYPHITVARIKRYKKTELTPFINNLSNLKIVDNFVIEEITLFKSTLTSSGPLYKDLVTFSLR